MSDPVPEATLKARYPTLMSFLDFHVKVYLLPDLDRLRHEIRPDSTPNASRGCTVPTAMFAFAVLDHFGFLMRPDPKAKREATSKNLEYILSQEADLFPPEYGQYSELLIKLFRHGMMHQIFPKACGIAKITTSGHDFPLVFDQDDVPNLNVDMLVDDIVKALDNLDARVRTAAHADLASRMEERLKSLYDDDQRNRDKLVSRLGPFPSSPAYTETSGQ